MAGQKREARLGAQKREARLGAQKREARLGAQKREARLGENVPAIHDFLTMRQQRRGYPRQARA
jgi:hypothetical protein